MFGGIEFCRKNNWNQGKALHPFGRSIARILPKEQLESRQSRAGARAAAGPILPKEQLESRQSQASAELAEECILPKEQLESRQSQFRIDRSGARILPKEQLESRQSQRRTPARRRFILPKEQLESRQSQFFALKALRRILPKEQLESRQSRGGPGGRKAAILPKEQLESRQSRRAAVSASAQVVSCFQNTDTFNCRVSHTMLFPLAAPFLKAQKKKLPHKPCGSFFFAFRGTKRSENSDVLSGGDARTCSGTYRRGLPYRRSAFPPCTPGASPP